MWLRMDDSYHISHQFAYLTDEQHRCSMKNMVGYGELNQMWLQLYEVFRFDFASNTDQSIF